VDVPTTGPGARYGAAGWLAALLAALALYGATLAPDLVWHDAGYYQWEAARLNLVRPGEAVRVHPLFLVVAHGLGRVGLWDYAKAASVASALGAGLAVANVWLVVWLLVRRAGPATVAALSAMLAHTVWQLAVQPQTYGWSNAATLGMLAAAVAYARGGRSRWLIVLLLVGGLGLSVHLMSQLALAVLGAWVLVRVVRGRTQAWAVAAGAAAWAVGGALFWYVAWLEYERTGDVRATAVSALLGDWGYAVFNVAGLPRMLLRSALMLVLNFPTPLVLVGAYGVWRSGRVLASAWLVEGRAAAGVAAGAADRSSAGGGGSVAGAEARPPGAAGSAEKAARAGRTMALLLGATLAVHVLFAARYRVPNQNFFFTPAYLLLAVYVGLGVHAAGWWARPWARAAVVVVAAVAVVPAYWAMAQAARAAGFNLKGEGEMHEVPYRDIYTYYLLPWQQGQAGPRRFAEESLAVLPPGAVLLPDTTTAAPLKCLRDVEGRRPDVVLVDPYDAKFDPSLRRYWRSEEDLLPALAAEGRRVFVASDQAGYAPRWVERYGCLVPRGPIFEVRPRPAEGGP